MHLQVTIDVSKYYFVTCQSKLHYPIWYWNCVWNDLLKTYDSSQHCVQVDSKKHQSIIVVVGLLAFHVPTCRSKGGEGGGVASLTWFDHQPQWT